MNHLLNFTLGSASTFGLLSAMNVDELPTGGTIEELINYLIAVFGGILSTIILNFLKKKFPALFESMKKRSRESKE